MLSKRLVLAVLGLSAAVALLGGSLHVGTSGTHGTSLGAVLSAPVAHAAGANTAFQFCREAQAIGELDELGITFGDCVNLVKGPASPQANNLISAVCGEPGIQAEVGASNRGQCIQIVKTLM